MAVHFSLCDETMLFSLEKCLVLIFCDKDSSVSRYYISLFTKITCNDVELFLKLLKTLSVSTFLLDCPCKFILLF